jgi:two-component system invasion response regulator UvrY
MNKIKILIADDHPIVHKGVSYLINQNFPGAFIKSVFDGDMIFKELSMEDYNVLILDVNLPLFSYQEFELIISRFPKVPVLIYSQNPEEQYAIRFLKGGAFGYVEKSEEDDVLISAIRKIIIRERHFSKEIMSIMLDKLQGKMNDNPFDLLSSREYDVATLMLKGKSLGEIAEELSISASTVSSYKIRIFEKLSVRNVVEFIDLANRYRLK